MTHPAPQKPAYRGRFAPSPTGLLHQGSLTAALGSYLDAKANHGEWLLRIEDIDPPREEENAKDLIPRQLEQHGLEWDGPIIYQSQRGDYYRKYLRELDKLNAIYPCSCSRQQIKEMGGIYDRSCLKKPPSANTESAIRLRIEGAYEWKDLIQGQIKFSPESLGGDFIVHRKDGLFSYQLAVAVDDHLQAITHVIRGADLIDSTARQSLIMQSLGWQPPVYGHLPLVKGSDGHKLSKQTSAPILDSSRPLENLYKSLQILGQNPPATLLESEQDELIQWAVTHWTLNTIPKDICIQ